MTVHCQREGCDLAWDEDPVTTVACPTCGAAPGVACRQPSGHNTWNVFGRFHAERDLKADREGAYGPPDHCPLGLCGHANQARAAKRAQARDDAAPARQTEMFEAQVIGA